MNFQKSIAEQLRLADTSLGNQQAKLKPDELKNQVVRLRRRRQLGRAAVRGSVLVGGLAVFVVIVNLRSVPAPGQPDTIANVETLDPSPPDSMNETPNPEAFAQCMQRVTEIRNNIATLGQYRSDQQLLLQKNQHLAEQARQHRQGKLDSLRARLSQSVFDIETTETINLAF